MSFKDIEIDIQNNVDKPLKVQKAFWMDYIPRLPQQDLDYLNRRLRGNNKVAFCLAYQEIKGEK